MLKLIIQSNNTFGSKLSSVTGFVALTEQYKSVQFPIY